MDNKSFSMAILFPFLALLTIVVIAGGLGIVFTILNETTAIGEWSVIILGVALTVGVPTVAMLLQGRAEKE